MTTQSLQQVHVHMFVYFFMMTSSAITVCLEIGDLVEFGETRNDCRPNTAVCVLDHRQFLGDKQTAATKIYC